MASVFENHFGRVVVWGDGKRTKIEIKNNKNDTIQLDMDKDMSLKVVEAILKEVKND